MTKLQEKELFARANQALWCFDTWTPSESPDILVHTESKVIGIELSEVTRKDHGEVIAAKYKLEDQLVFMITNQLNESDMDLSLHGTIDFKPELYLSQNHKKKFVSKVVSTIIAHSKSLMKESWSADHHIDKFLPDEINWISYDCYPFMDESGFYAARQKTQEFLEPEDVIEAITRKESKYEQYKERCTDVYLLLIEGLVPASWIGELRKPPPQIETQFDQVVLFHYNGSKIVKIK